MQRKLVRPAARRAFTAIVVQLAASVAARGPARAQQLHPPIVLALDPCTELDAQEVRRLVPIEMGAPLVGDGGDPRETTRVSVGCVLESPSVVRLEVRDPTTGKSLDRFITLRGVPKADQARLVAIAAVELVAASGGDLSHAPENPSPAAGAAGVVPPQSSELALRAAPRAEPAAAPLRWRVAVVGAVRHFGGLSRLEPGGGLAVQRRVRRGLVFGADLLAEWAQQPTTLGGVDCLLVSGSLVGLGRVELGPLTFETGPGARLGVVRLSGRPGFQAVAPGTVTAPWVGPLVALRALVTLPRHFALAFGAELGYATAGALGRTVMTSGALGPVAVAPDVSVRGTWWGATAGVGYAY
jgi:hypothetical protein